MAGDAGQTDGSYDYIMAGGGLAGLSLAYHIERLASRPPRMLIIDPDRKENDDRTWCFWTAQATPFDHVVYHVWHRAAWISDRFQRVEDLAPYRCQMIRGAEFYPAAREALAQTGRAAFVYGRVDEIQDSKNGAQVLAAGKAYLGNWVFDSLL